MVGENYWTTGIELEATYNGDGNPPKWGAKLYFSDDGVLCDNSTNGTLQVRYYFDNPATPIKSLVADAKRMGIEFRYNTLYVPGDGEGEKAEYLPADWRVSLAKVAKECGMDWPYALNLDTATIGELKALSSAEVYALCDEETDTCHLENKDGFICTRIKNHKGAHIARIGSDKDPICAIWLNLDKLTISDLQTAKDEGGQAVENIGYAIECEEGPCCCTSGKSPVGYYFCSRKLGHSGPHIAFPYYTWQSQRIEFWEE
jgi:hypothetical protein